MERRNPQLLIAQDENKSLAAIERVSKGIYALCPLAPWVTLQDFGRRAAKLPRIDSTYEAKQPSSNREWWSAASIADPIKAKKDSTKLIDFILADRPRKEGISERTSPRKRECTLAPASPPAGIESLTETQQIESTNWLQAIRQHYLNALYTSRAPLAYFVKGPLSRARVACQASDSNDNLAQLLRSTILPVRLRSNAAVIDKKYNSTLPEALEEIPPGITLEDGTDIPGLSQDRVSKSKRRKKLTAGGLLPGEEEYIVKWWIQRETTMSHERLEDPRDKRMKYAIAEQKVREVQLQIILILEILALERSSVSTTRDNPIETQEEALHTQPNSKREKKLQDLPRTLDALVEKLQIWETTNEDVMAISTMSSLKNNGTSSSFLRSFCLEIILPFFTSRIPDISKDLCQKFGVVTSPKKTLTRSRSSNQIHAKPGEPLKDRRPRRTLDRVLTNDTALSKRRNPSLARSATDSLVPTIKQELEDICLSNIPFQRPSIYASNLYTRREVDLTAETKATEAKLKRKAEMEQELKGAIFALKRPNARLAVKEFVDASDQRKVQRKPRSRKSQNPIRDPFATGVQVVATPRINRVKPGIALNQELYFGLRYGERDSSYQSDNLQIPSSTKKPSNHQPAMSHNSVISATPSKSSKTIESSGRVEQKEVPRYGSLNIAKSQMRALEEQHESGSEPELPLLRPPPTIMTNQAVTATPTKEADSRYHGQMTSNRIISTPRKNTSDGEAIPDSSPTQMRKQAKVDPTVKAVKAVVKETSIYDALGWDNDFDDI